MTLMRTIMLIIFCLITAALAPATVEAAEKDCFTVTSSKWKVCGEKKQGLTLNLKNICVETMQLKLCIKKEDGEWDCKWFRDIKKETGLDMESCDNTGEYKINACEDYDDCKDKKGDDN